MTLVSNDVHRTTELPGARLRQKRHLPHTCCVGAWQARYQPKKPEKKAGHRSEVSAACWAHLLGVLQ